jgi:hypothetical protein
LEVRSDRTWRFDADAPTVWSALTDIGAYREWWPWLSRFDGDTFAAGARWNCTIQPPLPYTMKFTLWLEDVVACQAVEATVAGDIEGSARLSLQADGDATLVRLVSDLAPANPFLKRVAWVATPIVRFGHDWVLDTGAAQFRRRAFRP